MAAVRPAFPGPPASEEMTPCEYVRPEGILYGDPQEREYVYLATPDGSFTAGVWEAQPYSERIEGYPGNEYCQVIRGKVTLTDTDGTSQTFATGDSFVLDARWSGTWTVEEPFMKYFAISIPAGG